MKLIAHRSGPSIFPEQTIISARHALSQGADLVEIDVRLTADKQIAVTHDQNLMRIFGVDRNIGDITAQEFLSLRHAKDPAFPAHLLEHYLQADIAPLLLHIKEYAVIDELLRIIDAYGYADRVVLGVATPATARQIRAHNPELKILTFSKQEYTDEFISMEVDYIRLWESWLTPELVQKVKSSKSECWVMSGNTDGFPVGKPGPDNLRAILAFQPDGLLIDDISQAQACQTGMFAL